MSNFKSIREYFSTYGTFVVPYYQRGYKWSLQKNIKRGELHLILLLKDLIREFQNAFQAEVIQPHYEYYLQGITVKEKGKEIELVDGQQRTTSIFILLCCLQQRGLAKEINLHNKLNYKVRKAANQTLQNFIEGINEGDENIQDIAALRKAWTICERYLNLHIKDTEKFTEFLLDHIKIIYIKLDKNQDEAKVFSMMNKSKAEMTQTDLIKSNLLREASRQMFGNLQGKVQNDGLEWQINQLRSKLATEWDNWRKWWENPKQKDFGKMIALPLPAKDSEEPAMSAILQFYGNLDTEKKPNESLYEFFKNQIIKAGGHKIAAIEVFNELRFIQNVLREWYEDYQVYNYLGVLFKGSGLHHKEKVLKELFYIYKTKKTNFHEEIKKIYISEVLGDNLPDQFINSLIKDENVYFNQYTKVARQLLRMNVLMANKQKQKFDFTLYEEENFKNEDQIKDADKRSLEHIKPQTFRGIKLDKKEREKLNKLTNTVGNLVLVPKGLNSMLSNKTQVEKKQILFEKMLKPEGRNFGLWLHTLSVFGSNTQWLSKEIKKNEEVFTKELTTFFNN